MNIKKKNIRSDRTERILDKGHDMGSTGIVDTIRQRLKDIELQHWTSETDNDVRRILTKITKWQHTENLKQ